MTDIGTDVGDMIGLGITAGVGLMTLDLLGHGVRHIEDDMDRRPHKKVQPKQAQQRRRDDDWFPEMF